MRNPLETTQHATPQPTPQAHSQHASPQAHAHAHHTMRSMPRRRAGSGRVARVRVRARARVRTSCSEPGNAGERHRLTGGEGGRMGEGEDARGRGRPLSLAPEHATAACAPCVRVLFWSGANPLKKTTEAGTRGFVFLFRSVNFFGFTRCQLSVVDLHPVVGAVSLNPQVLPPAPLAPWHHVRSWSQLQGVCFGKGVCTWHLALPSTQNSRP